VPHSLKPICPCATHLYFLQTKQRKLLINNEWVNGQQWRHDPYYGPCTGEILAEVVSAQKKMF